MIVEASVTGLFRTLLIIVGGIMLLRFLGQFMNAKRNMEEERDLNAQNRKFTEEKQKSKNNIGKTKILNKKGGGIDAEDVDFEEIE